MADAVYVGRVGALAAALGIGVAVWSGGCAVAAADSTGSSGETSSTSAASGTSSGSSESDSTTDAATGTTTSGTASSPSATSPSAISGTATSPSATSPSVASPSTAVGTATGTGGAQTGTHSTTSARDHTAPPRKERRSATAAESTRPTTARTAAGDAQETAPSHVDDPAEPATSAVGEQATAPAPAPVASAVPAVVDPGPAAIPTVTEQPAVAVPKPVDTVTAAPADVPPAAPPAAPLGSPVSWTIAAAARKESLVPGPVALRTTSSTDDAATVQLAAAAVAAAPPVVAVVQTPPLGWLQQIPLIGPVFVTPVVGALHQIPIFGDIIHPFVGYPVQYGAPGAPVSRDVMLTSFDGTQIYVHFMPAKGLQSGQLAPTVFQGPGLGMPGATNLDGTFLDGILTDNLGAVGVGPLRAAGYNVVTWDPRGEYRSGGTLEVDSPDFEARDTSAIISWVATQPEVLLDAPGDPRMGMVGASYGGGIQFVTAAIDHRVDALVPTIAWNTLNSSLYKSEAFKSGWGTLLAAALLLTGARPNSAIYPAAIQGDITGQLTQEQQDLLADRGPDALLGNITAPTLIIQGTVDTLFSLQEAQENALALIANGVPTKVLWFCGGHGVCTNNLFDPTDGQVITEATFAWLARYVKGQTGVSTGPQFEWVDQRGQYYSSTTYPAAPSASIVAASQGGTLPLFPVLGGSGPLLFVLPIGGTRALNALNVNLPAATQTTYVVGAPTLTMTYSGTGTSRHVYAQLVDDATGAVLGNQVTPIPVTLDGQSHTVTIDLEQVAHTLNPGQALTLQLVASTVNYENFGAFGFLDVSSVGVSVPTIADAVPLDRRAPAAVSA